MKIVIYIFLTYRFIAGIGIDSVLALPNKFASYDSNFLMRNTQTLQNEDIEELVRNAFELYKQKSYEESLAVCVKAAELSPNDFRPHSIKGLVYLAQQKFKIASEEFAKSISLKPTIQAYMLKAIADERRGEIEEAIATYRQAIEFEPNLAEAFWGIGDILINDEKRRDEALIAYQSAVKINPELNMLYEYLGEKILNTKKDEKLAEYIFRKQIAADEKHMIGRFPLGRLLVKQGSLKEARELWNNRTSDKDNTMPSFIALLERAEKLKQANDELSQKPDDPETLLQMGFAVMDGDSWVVDGRQERAIFYFQKALAIKPDFAMAQYGICKAYIQIADIVKDKNKNVDEELGKLKKLDLKLSRELEDYRKTYSGGLKAASPVKTNQ